MTTHTSLRELADDRRTNETATAALTHLQHALDKLMQHPVVMVPGKVPQLMVPGETPVRVLFDLHNLKYTVSPYLNARTAPDAPLEVLERHAIYARAFEAMLNAMPKAQALTPPTPLPGRDLRSLLALVGCISLVAAAAQLIYYFAS